MVSERYRREAELIEQAATCISLQSDKEGLLAEARSLRQLAETFEPPQSSTEAAENARPQGTVSPER